MRRLPLMAAVAGLEADPSVEDSPDNLPALTEAGSAEKPLLIDPGAARSHEGGGALASSVRAADRRQRDRYHHQAVAGCASGLRGDRGDPLQPPAQPPGQCDLRGNGRAAEQWIEATPAAQVDEPKTTRIDRPKRQARTEIHTSGGRRELPSSDGRSLGHSGFIGQWLVCAD